MSLNRAKKGMLQIILDLKRELQKQRAERKEWDCTWKVIEKNVRSLEKEIRKVKEETEKLKVCKEKMMTKLNECDGKKGSIDTTSNEKDGKDLNNNKEKERLTQAEKRIQESERRIEQMERRRRKNNIVITGIKDSMEEFKEKEVKPWLKIKLMIEVEINDLWKIGGTEKSILVIECRNWKEKEKVMKNKSKLAGTSIYINNDLTWKERKMQKAIRQYAQELRKNGHGQVTVGYGKLLIGDKLYEWDENRQDVHPLTDTERKENQEEKEEKEGKKTERKEKSSSIRACEKKLEDMMELMREDERDMQNIITLFLTLEALLDAYFRRM